MKTPTGYTIMRCYMCGKRYLHPVGAIAGVGKCRRCFWAQIDGQKSQIRQYEGRTQP